MSEFCGTYTLVENTNMRAFATATFPSALSKIAFHSGIESKKLYDLLAKTLIQLIISKDDVGMITLTLTFDKNPHHNGDHNHEAENRDDGLTYSTQFRLGEEHLLHVPISGEKAKSMVKRRQGNVNALEQITQFQSGPVEIVFCRNEAELKLQYLHKSSGIKAAQVFKKNACFEANTLLRDNNASIVYMA